MFRQDFETSATPHITVTECSGNLVVRGSEGRQVAIHLRGSANDLDLDQEGETFTITTRADCVLTCPPDTTLTIGTVHGNLKVEGVEGPVAANITYGNAKLRGVGPVAVEQTFGNLTMHKVRGDLHTQTTVGNARIHQLEGSLSMGQVDGNLRVDGLRGGLAVERVRGNVRLASPFLPDQTYRLTTDGNLTVRLPVEASLQLAIQARGGVRSSIPGLELEEADGGVRGILGAGEASLEAQVSGYVSLRPLEPDEELQAEGIPLDFVADLEGLGANIETHIAEAMAEMETRLAESLGRIDSEALRSAGQAAEHARRTADREAERARLRAERAERRWRRASGQRRTPKRELATDEERMRVLHMVEEGKITPEQAAELLAALEGR